MRQNFLNTPTPRQQREQLIWFIIACSTLALTIITIGSLQLIQAYHLWNAAKRYDQEAQEVELFDSLVAQEKELKQEIAQFKKTLDAITAQQKTNRAFADALQVIMSVIPYNMLKRLEFANEKIEITFLIPSLDTIQTYLIALAKEPWCDTVQVHSIDQGTNESDYRTTLVIQMNQKPNV